MRVIFEHDRAALLHGDSKDLGEVLDENSVDAMVCDPPAGIAFMAKGWDKDKGGRDGWIAWLAATIAPAFRALKPGAHALVWALPRTSHWTATALENAGFEIRDIHLHLFGCVPTETEMLTERGWRLPSQLQIGENVAQVDAQGAVSFGPLRAVSVYPFDGEMHRITTRSTEQLLTPGHTVHAYAKRAKWKHIDTDNTLTALPADSFTDEDHVGVTAWILPLAARGAPVRRELACVDVASLYGWVISEGHFQAGTPAVNLYQNEGPNADKIRDLLHRLAIPHSEYKRTRDDYDGTPRPSVQWYIKVGAWSEQILADLDGTKPTPPEWLAWLPDDQARALFEALVDGDGSRNTDTSGAWYQKRPEVRAWFQTLCFRLGYRSTENANKCAVQWTRSDSTEVQRGRHRKRWSSRMPFRGEVWCPTVTTGRWVARYRGNVFVTGNTGFPKSLSVSKAIDEHVGATREVLGERPGTGSKTFAGEANGKGLGPVIPITEPASDEAKRWDGWGTALKPAAEHWILCRKPLIGTVAANVIAHGTGGLNIDACRIGRAAGDRTEYGVSGDEGCGSQNTYNFRPQDRGAYTPDDAGRWPAHVSLDEEAAAILDEQSGELTSGSKREDIAPNKLNQVYGKGMGGKSGSSASKGGASRFFYVAKGARSEKDAGLEHLPKRSGGEATDREDGSAGLANPRAGAGRTGGARNFHPTVKSSALMRWLVRLITPPGGTVLDPFAGSGSTGVAALAEGFSFIGCEQGGKADEYLPILIGRIRHALGIAQDAAA